MSRVTRSLCVIALLVCISAQFLPSGEATNIYGVGGALPSIIIDEWIYAYAVLRPDVTINYNIQSSGAGAAAIAQGTVDFASSDPALTNSQLKNIHPSGDVLQFAFVATPIAILVNIPSLTKLGLQVVLDRITLVRIYSLDITNWRDPAILALNTAQVQSVLPNATIQVMVHGLSSGTTNILTNAFSSFAPSGGSFVWPYGALNVFPWTITGNPNVFNVSSNFGIPGAVLLTPYSIGYCTFTQIASQLGAVTQAILINKANNSISDPIAGTQAAVAAASPTNYETALTDSTASGAWPLAGWSHLLLRKTNYANSTNCVERREALLFLNWALSSDQAQDRMTFQGYVSAGDAINALSIASLGALPCTGQSFPAMAYIPLAQHNPAAAFQAVLAVAMILLGFAVLTEFVYFLIERAALLKSGKYQRARLMFYVMVSSGTVMNYLCIIFFYLTPDADYVCQLRLWLPCLGFALLLGAMFVRGLQVQLLWRMEQPGSQFSQLKTANHGTIIYAAMITITGLQALLLTVWTAVDSFKSIRDDVNDLDLTFRYICASQHTWLWWGLEIAFVFLLVAFGLAVIYWTWDIKSKISEWKWVSTATYNTALVVVVMISIFASVPLTDDFVFWVAAPCIMILNTVTVAVFFLPRIYREVCHKIIHPTDHEVTQSGQPRLSVQLEEGDRDTHTSAALSAHHSPRNQSAGLRYGSGSDSGHPLHPQPSGSIGLTTPNSNQRYSTNESD